MKENQNWLTACLEHLEIPGLGLTEDVKAILKAFFKEEYPRW